MAAKDDGCTLEVENQEGHHCLIGRDVNENVLITVLELGSHCQGIHTKAFELRVVAIWVYTKNPQPNCFDIINVVLLIIHAVRGGKATMSVVLLLSFIISGRSDHGRNDIIVWALL